MASAKSGERASSFAMACSLLSRYVRQNGAAAGELGLGIRGEAADAPRTPATMSFLPGSDAEKGELRKETMKLFPQNAGFGSGTGAQDAPDASAADLPQARKASLHRFLEKRKDRLNAKAPYQDSPSDATPVKKELPESQPWLNLHRECSQ